MALRRRPKVSTGVETPSGLAAMSFSLGECQVRVDKRLQVWSEARFSRRLWSKDATLWAPGPVPGIHDRLGWLDLPERMAPRLAELKGFADEIRSEDFTQAVLLGMGGSSLTPEVLERTFGDSPGRPKLTVLDSTHPGAVAAVEARIDLPRTLFIVSSKSGTTVEPLSLFRYFWDRAARFGSPPGRRFIAITDPGTPLAALAKDTGFRRVFEAEADVGGRFSALTEFGLVPAALIGIDIDKLLAGAAVEARANGPDVPEAGAPGLRLGAALGEGGSVRDKLTILTSPGLRTFPDWVEQLVAESTGKDGKGIVPVVNEPDFPVSRFGSDRMLVSLTMDADGDSNRDVENLAASVGKSGHPVVRLQLTDAYSLGGEFFRWEMAVAAAGSVLGINPFNQPDVELAKELARKAMARRIGGEAAAPGWNDSVETANAAALRTALDGWLARTRPGDYLALQAYIAPNDGTDRALQALRLTMTMRTGLATTLGYGPRFLHSTGQLHKGGPDEACVLQLVDEPERDLPVPGTDLSFGRLIHAQAVGDFQALVARGRRVLRVNLGRDPAGGLTRLAALAST
jgi:transaldolase/glucose-6-phosphate isomerase